MTGGGGEYAKPATERPARVVQDAPASLAPLVETILSLQRSAGNAAVGRLLRARRVLARAPALPGFKQVGDTCGAASLVTALFVWDLERADPTNRAVVHACDLLLTATDTKAFASSTGPKADIKDIRNKAATPGTKLGQADYAKLATAIATLYGAGAGASSEDIHAYSRAMGLAPGGGDSGSTTLSDILNSKSVTDLKPGEVGQLNWITSTGGGHAMTLGHHEDGTWFFSDQASPGSNLQSPTHADLAAGIGSYVSFGGWLHPGSKAAWLSPPVIGFRPMGHIQGFLNRGPMLGPTNMLITPGEQLAEIDAGAGTSGEVLTAWDYHSTHDTLAGAQSAIGADPGGHGGVIVERPKDTFHVVKTNPLSTEGNLKETKIDEGDSKKMVLVERKANFFSAWLVLSDSAGKKRAPFKVI
jgi:hypothetical protein